MKVFLSSTAVDLVAYRQMADDTILRLSQQAVAMERFGPLSGTPVEECEPKKRESDVVICIVAHRYGFESEKGLGSITRREVEAARSAGKDVLVWIVADDHPWTEKKESDLLTDPTVLADPERVADVVAGVSGLIEFKAWLRKTFVCDTFTTLDELGRKIAVALSNRSAPRTPSTAPAPKQGEARIVHALQPAPHFHGRDGLVKQLTDWVGDAASPDRVWALVAAGGTGKTAIAERVIRDMEPGEANVLVWSFYERPEADAFLRECNQLFLGEEDGPAGGRLERLQRGLRDGRPHLIVLDGHALSVAVLGSYLRFFAAGDVEAVKDFDLDAVTSDDPRAAKLTRVLAYYAKRLSVEERELLARLSVFPRGVTLDLLGVVIDGGGELAGLLVNAKPRLLALFGSLRDRGLIFEDRSGAAVIWTAHPFLRERFRALLGCPAERVFDVVAEALGAGLERRPDTKPSEPALLDRYERLIEATRLAGREQEAQAIQAARQALELATAPECQYAWGEADAAHVWGEAYFANHEPELAHRAFTQALAVRKRIERPGVADTEKWLAMTAV